jgi:hypothetical protein
MNYLVDTNIFLEILPSRAGGKKCETFLESEKGAAWISDFTVDCARRKTSIGKLGFRLSLRRDWRIMLSFLVAIEKRGRL